ncbi:MAG: hypothetical protein ACR2I2_10765, partial [Bryobacteraceae bacterium]
MIREFTLHGSLMLLYVVIMITANAQNITPNKNLSLIDRSEVASLTSKADRLQKSTTFWNIWYLGLVGFAVVITAGTFLSQYLALKNSNELASTESLLSSAKDRALASELKDKDLKIGDLNIESGKLSAVIAEPNVKWTQLSRPFFGFYLLVSDESEFVFGTASVSKPSPAIPALES